jgi:uncharacterized protein YwgA
MVSTATRAILELIAAAGGKIQNRISIQKMAFLLAAKGNTRFSLRAFSYHYYGPFSRELSDALHQAVLAGLLNEDQTNYGNGSVKYEYSVSEAGQEWIDRKLLEEDGTNANVGVMRDAHWRALELASTALFLQRDQPKLSRDGAMAYAIELKPATVEYRAAAETLLERLSL